MIFLKDAFLKLHYIKLSSYIKEQLKLHHYLERVGVGQKQLILCGHQHLAVTAEIVNFDLYTCSNMLCCSIQNDYLKKIKTTYDQNIHQIAPN